MIAKLNEQGCHVEGVFTHFATADEADLDKFEQQFSFFSELVDNLAYKPDLVHASNSATSIWHSETIFNAVRLGIVIYGLNSSGRELELPFPLKPALSLESSLVHVKKLEAGADIGYRATYTTSGEEYIGTVPIIYADGWTLHLPKKYTLGIKVSLIGGSGDNSVSATNLAQYKQTINYEVLCLLSDRIPRIY